MLFSFQEIRSLTYIIGERPFPSFLAGGDLDGDPYNVTDFMPLFPQHLCPPGEYEVAGRRLLRRNSTLHDAAEFFTEFVTNNVSLHSS